MAIGIQPVPRVSNDRDFSKGSIGEKFAAFNERTNGFDYLRLCLALGVIFWHGVIASYGPEFDKTLHATPIGTVARMILPMFFALSGFLVAGSLVRTPSLRVFALHRVLRIFPALSVEVALSGLLLGLLVTEVSLTEYFFSTGFVRYLFNVFGIISIWLPGVFQDNPVDWVNISLWTVPYELECYLVLIGIAAIGLARRVGLYIAAFVGVCVIIAAIDLMTDYAALAVNRVPPRVLITCFLAGVGFYLIRGRVPVSFPLFIISAVVAYLCTSYPILAYLTPVPIAYMTVYLGLLNIPRAPVILDGDYSYGMYLYAFPFQQLQVYLFPDNRGWIQNMVFAIPCVIVFAAFSWHVIEKPILQKRKVLVAWSEKHLDALGAGLRARLPFKPTPKNDPET